MWNLLVWNFIHIIRHSFPSSKNINLNHNEPENFLLKISGWEHLNYTSFAIVRPSVKINENYKTCSKMKQNFLKLLCIICVMRVSQLWALIFLFPCLARAQRVYNCKEWFTFLHLVRPLLEIYSHSDLRIAKIKIKRRSWGA